MTSAHRLKVCEDIRAELTEKIREILLKKYGNGKSKDVTIPYEDVDAIMNGLINFVAQVNAQLFYDAVGKSDSNRALNGCEKITKEQFLLFEKVFKYSLEQYIDRGN